ncbi:hypothetical protein MMC10_001326 [Thelotrema lepadinum]|nr:hypothetical protein [Thelotrema lepadinum]
MTATSTSESVINEFMSHYPWEFKAYEEYAKTAHDICKEQLREAGIPAIFTYRAKQAERLRMKLEGRAKKTTYTCGKDIRADIKDLAGARIAVYYPDQKDEVRSIISSTFENVNEVEKKPRQEITQETKEKQVYKRRFFDYDGNHYHVKIPPHKLDHAYRSPDLNFMAEVQVVTVISSAWSQVEHDIVYKKITGIPSKDEYRILDQFNGLVHMGESLLEQLYETHRARINVENSKFVDEYDLGSYLRKWISQNPERVKSNVNLGPVRGLFALLQIPGLELSTPKGLAKELDQTPSMAGLLSSDDGDLQRTETLPGEPTYTSSLSLFVMKDLYDRCDLASKAKRRVMLAATSVLGSECSARLKIIASTIMWLDELFRGEDWEDCLFREETKRMSDEEEEERIVKERKNALAWLLRLRDDDMSVVNIWLDGRTPTQPAMPKINVLWCWLDEHRNESVQFVFNLSRLGMLKDPTKEAAQLQSIGSYLEYVGDLPNSTRSAS